jgi:hypothetical protein
MLRTRFFLKTDFILTKNKTKTLFQKNSKDINIIVLKQKLSVKNNNNFFHILKSKKAFHKRSDTFSTSHSRYDPSGYFYTDQKINPKVSLRAYTQLGYVKRNRI